MREPVTFPDFLAAVERLRHHLAVGDEARTAQFVAELLGNPLPVFTSHGAKRTSWQLRNAGRPVSLDGLTAGVRDTYAQLRRGGWTDYAIGQELRTPGSVRAMCLAASASGR